MTDQDQPLSQPSREAGFTLVEMMIVIFIIALLSTTVFFAVRPSQDKAMIEKAKNDVRQLETALEMYRLDMLNYPSEQVGLAALTRLPAGTPNAERYSDGGYIKLLPKDPWGRDYLYRFPGENGVLDLYSLGADGVEGGEGINADIVNWQP